jgi:microcompartment protein CcmL/EutN
MTRYPAIALLELNSIAAGTTAADAMIKAAPIDKIQAGTIHRGKYLILVGGSVAAVEQSYVEGRRVGADALVDEVFLPDMHEEVHDAILGTRRNDAYDALGIIETQMVAATVRASDAGVKGARAHVLEIRLGDGLSGKGIVLLTGTVADVEAAVQIGREAIEGRPGEVWSTVIPALHEDLIREVRASTRFGRDRGV